MSRFALIAAALFFAPAAAAQTTSTKCLEWAPVLATNLAVNYGFTEWLKQDKETFGPEIFSIEKVMTFTSEPTSTWCIANVVFDANKVMEIEKNVKRPAHQASKAPEDATRGFEATALLQRVYYVGSAFVRNRDGLKIKYRIDTSGNEQEQLHVDGDPARDWLCSTGRGLLGQNWQQACRIGFLQ